MSDNTLLIIFWYVMAVVMFGAITSVLTMELYKIAYSIFPNWCVSVPYLGRVVFKIIVLLFLVLVLSNYIAFTRFGFLIIPFVALVWSSKEKMSQRKKLVAPMIISLINVATFYMLHSCVLSIRMPS